MARKPKIEEALREAIIAQPDVILDDKDVMHALIECLRSGQSRITFLAHFLTNQRGSMLFTKHSLYASDREHIAHPAF